MGPLFNGISEQDQLQRIIKVFGTPSQSECPELYNYASQMKFQFPQVNPANLSLIFPNASQNAIDLIYNPLQRPSCDTMLKHPFFADLNLPNLPLYNTPSNIIQKMQKKQDFGEYIDGINQDEEAEKQKQIAEEKESELLNSQKKSKFSQQHIRLSVEVDSDNYTPSDTEQSQYQFSHLVQKHLEQEDDVKLKLIGSETQSNDNTTKNKDFTPS